MYYQGVKQMNTHDEYFDAIIGSVTLDIYQPKSSGVMLQIESTQGYHEKTVHLATRYPRILKSTSNILKLFPNQVWLATGVSILALSRD